MQRADYDPSLGVECLEPHDDFAERLESHIGRNLCGRVSDLRVARRGEFVILQGRCRTYHAKQLVLQAVLELADPLAGVLVNQIVVA